jgi:hypothetical protein
MSWQLYTTTLMSVSTSSPLCLHICNCPHPADEETHGLIVSSIITNGNLYNPFYLLQRYITSSPPTTKHQQHHSPCAWSAVMILLLLNSFALTPLT